MNQIPEEDDCVSIEDELNVEEEKGDKGEAEKSGHLAHLRPNLDQFL